MTIEPARDVRRVTVDERAWFVAAALLIAACLSTAFSVVRQWSPCVASPTSQDCLALLQTMNMLPIQADTMALRVPWAALFAALGLTLATGAWLAFLLLHPLGRGIKIAGAVVAVPLLIMSLGGWFGVWSVESWVAGHWLPGLRDDESGSGEPQHDAAAGGLDLRRHCIWHHASVCGVHSLCLL
jgi:hypothetical protein